MPRRGCSAIAPSYTEAYQAVTGHIAIARGRGSRHELESAAILNTLKSDANESAVNLIYANRWSDTRRK